MSDLIFYTNPVSRGRVARWMLEEIGHPYETVVLTFEEMERPGYRMINPIGKVPALTHEGKLITETAAICAYLADACPEAGLAPKVRERANYYRWLFFMAGPGEAAVVDKLMGVAPSAEQRRFVGYGNFDAMMMMLEVATTKHPYIAGDRFTAADVYFGGQLIFGTEHGSMPERPSFAAYKERLVARPAYLRAKSIDDALAVDGR
ncbi:glutathione S-transferase family protein [Bradyrhizobium sp. BRP22]|uniref:glutathione S-transferase family protein n=1 Tax=Bradyrhizobium sp. BRP22 TaxID=2793821 RepID=UPI0031FD851B